MEESALNYPVTSKRTNQMIPTLEINKKLETKKNVAIAMSATFILLEAVLFTLIYFYLYEYRIAAEFKRSMDLFNIDSPRFLSYFIFYAISSIVYMFFVYRYKIFQFRASSGLADELFKMSKAFSFAILVTIGVSFFLKYIELSRLVIFLYWASAVVACGALRIAKRFIYFRFARHELVAKNVIIVGAGKVGQSLMDEIKENKWLGYKIVGFVDDKVVKDFSGYRYLGTTSELKEIIQKHLADELIITIPSERELVHSIITDLRKIDIKIKIIPDMFNLVMSTVQIGNLSSLPVVTLVKTPMRGFGLLFKRIFDIVSACIIFVLISPIFLATAIAIKLDSPGPVFYRQQRLGKNGKMFHMLKFRSMVTDAEALLSKLQQHNEVDGIAFKMKHDPRTTKVGRFIRKYSIDELPQLLNVIKGDMSLVGPRPPLPNEVQQYGDWEWRRLEVLPGMTGLWQVSGRSDLSFQQWMSLDIYYIENWSVSLDLKILLKTIPVVLKGEGAY